MALNVILFFEIYAFLGWIMECLYTRYDELRWVNRGFLHGPFCPIYGLGAVGCLIFLEPLQRNMYIFVPVTMLVATSLEYFIGWFFEHTFDIRLWTYSHKPFNLHGRICVEFTLLWGLFGVVFVKIIHPHIIRFIDMFDPRLVNLTSASVGILLILDLIVSAAQTAVSTERLKNLDRIETRIKQNSDELASASGDSLTGIQAKLNELKDTRDLMIDTLVSKSRRLIEAFPSIDSPHYPHALSYLKERIRAYRDKKNEEE